MARLVTSPRSMACRSVLPARNSSFKTFKYQNIGIYRHADAQDKPGNTRQGKDYRDHFEKHQGDDGIHDQG